MFTKAWQPPLCFETIKAYLPSFALHRSRKFHALGAWHYLFFMILSFFWTMIITWGGKMGSDHEILEYFTIKWRRKGFCSLRKFAHLKKSTICQAILPWAIYNHPYWLPLEDKVEEIIKYKKIQGHLWFVKWKVWQWNQGSNFFTTDLS